MDREETWDEDGSDAKHAKILEKEIVAERQLQKKLRDEMAKIDQKI